jgi:hypothetical protein
MAPWPESSGSRRRRSSSLIHGNKALYQWPTGTPASSTNRQSTRSKQLSPNQFANPASRSDARSGIARTKITHDSNRSLFIRGVSPLSSKTDSAESELIVKFTIPQLFSELPKLRFTIDDR